MGNQYEQYKELLQSFDKGYELCYEYDSMPHQYGDEVLYQSEMHFLEVVGDTPSITITVISQQLGKTKSACSQMVRKLVKKELLTQERNEKNNREYYLNLTERGKEIYEVHKEFDEKCMQRTYKSLADFSEEELRSYISVQKTLNQVFQKDVDENGVLEVAGKRKKNKSK
ncbi:MarR family transcriptional regulator [Mediterraneibacter butyricigenes]|uniref:MarR family transcriptional regulator n=1 Tax=Mediterraneibacter butyricigenes TaxID=2316025 RepID=A0A391P2J0_9FIRM|nr:MarR family transcriptional regulator [Mediterraneibacter butyricigenes]GCA67350.1 MarR family transcriptional regulator [Mediterraneibacter butyricigenes]